MSVMTAMVKSKKIQIIGVVVILVGIVLFFSLRRNRIIPYNINLLSGNIYYVSTSGNDGNSCTPGATGSSARTHSRDSRVNSQPVKVVSKKIGRLIAGLDVATKNCCRGEVGPESHRLWAIIGRGD